ncbi:Imm42 family immunity protein [Commensalibacter nepenthis]|uniref:Imm42 family immunity protein n=1 Tax=Commensalibacter nepenthis TaxID=3043872 RepID=A0ABT6Q618_9PROT|nr:Imm42 family immunity protein [Commensalibacter sp. TBRC 10068]MDI2112207.1 Imm42 family immunity protein [Commensalibacter sp. TBRC 10068]
MLYGNKDIFAIEYQIDEDHCGKLMMGNCCLYFQGNPIGKNPYTWYLVDLMMILKQLLKNNDQRYAPKLFALSDQEFSDVIYKVCFEDKDELFYQYLPQKRDLSDYMLVLDNTSVFIDDYIIYFVDNDEYTKVWYCKSTDPRHNHYKSFLIPLGEAEHVLEQAYQDLARLQPILIAEEAAKQITEKT